MAKVAWRNDCSKKNVLDWMGGYLSVLRICTRATAKTNLVWV